MTTLPPNAASATPAPTPPTPAEAVWGVLRRAAFSGVVLSIVIHLVGLFIAAHWMVGGKPYGGGEGEGKTVDFAVITEGELSRAPDEGAVDIQAPSVPESVSSEPVPMDLLDAPTADKAMGNSSGLGDVGNLAGAGDIGATGDGAGEGMGGAGGGGASFFGVESKGNRFAYVVDISGSMSVSGKIESLRTQLTESINGLLETSQFLVVPFSTEAAPMAGKREWVEASTSGKKWARTNISVLMPDGGTNPLPGFQIVFSMRPRPDAIYFMTDGEFEPTLADEIALMNKQFKVPIHCICLHSRESEEWMKKIARQSGGTYHFVAGPK